MKIEGACHPVISVCPFNFNPTCSTIAQFKQKIMQLKCKISEEVRTRKLKPKNTCLKKTDYFLISLIILCFSQNYLKHEIENVVMRNMFSSISKYTKTFQNVSHKFNFKIGKRKIHDNINSK